MKLQHFVTILSLAILQGSVCTQPGEVDSFNTHRSTLIATATCQIRWNFLKVIAKSLWLTLFGLLL